MFYIYIHIRLGVVLILRNSSYWKCQSKNSFFFFKSGACGLREQSKFRARSFTGFLCKPRKIKPLSLPFFYFPYHRCCHPEGTPGSCWGWTLKQVLENPHATDCGQDMGAVFATHLKQGPGVTHCHVRQTVSRTQQPSLPPKNSSLIPLELEITLINSWITLLEIVYPGRVKDVSVLFDIS